MSYWRVLGRGELKKSDTRRKEFWKAFQRLWVAGTLGALFFAIARNIPVHLAQFSISASIVSTLSVLLKYMFMVWLVAYFFVSNIDNEQASISLKDVAFDVMQSVGAIATAYSLGFVILGVDYGVGAYAVALFTIAGICSLSLLLYRQGSRGGVNPIRWIGLVLSGVGLALIGIASHKGWDESTITYCLFGVQLLLLFFLFVYLRICYDETLPTADQEKNIGLLAFARHASEAATHAADSAAAAASAAKASSAALEAIKPLDGK